MSGVSWRPGCPVPLSDLRLVTVSFWGFDNRAHTGVPGAVTVSSGSTLTFTYSDREQEPHTLTIVPRAELPRTLAQFNGPCQPCRKYASPHLKHRGPPGPGNPIVHWTLDQGQPGLDTVGDSLAIQPGAHKRNSAVVSAPAGTILYFMCAVHPWMQGKIIVK